MDNKIDLYIEIDINPIINPIIIKIKIVSILNAFELINKEIDLIEEEYGAVPKSINVEFINSREVGSFCNTYILRGVLVEI